MEGTRFITDFITNPQDLYTYLRDHITWDESMTTRKTASFGKTHNYAEYDDTEQEFFPGANDIIKKIEQTLGFTPNNCILNYYVDGSAKRNFHIDETEMLKPDTGIVIISLGATRTLRFRKFEDKDFIVDFDLPAGSFFYLDQKVQKGWEHSVPKSFTDGGRMSMVFRALV